MGRSFSAGKSKQLLGTMAASSHSQLRFSDARPMLLLQNSVYIKKENQDLLKIYMFSD